MAITHETVQGAAILAALVSVLVIWMTGATPLFWLSLLLACLEAGLRQAWQSGRQAVLHYLENYPGTLKQVRAEIAETAETAETAGRSGRS